jgi:hypothetical protein
MDRRGVRLARRRIRAEIYMKYEGVFLAAWTAAGSDSSRNGGALAAQTATAELCAQHEQALLIMAARLA